MCPSCRDICNCKKCLQTKTRINVPHYSGEQQQECARYLLATVAGPLAGLLKEWDDEVSRCVLAGVLGWNAVGCDGDAM